MSVKLLIATARPANVREFCLEHGISRSWYYELRARYGAEGEAGLQPRSRAPRVVANKTPGWIEDEIIRVRKMLDDDGLDAGAETIRWHLVAELGEEQTPSTATIWRILKSRGHIVDDPSKRPSKLWRRFEAERANELFQLDGTDHQLAGGAVVKIVNVIDDGSRYCPASRAHPSESFDAAWATLLCAFNDVGMCARVLSDNAKGFVKLKTPLAELGIAKTESSPFHPQTCGKVERFHQTQAKWLAARPQAETLTDLQDLLDEFRHTYNYQRPHRAIAGTTPAARRDAMPKAGPTNRPLNIDTPTTVHHTTVAANGLVYAGRYAISLGAAHAGRKADTIITGHHADVFVNSAHIRKLTINPNQRVQPLHQRPGRPRQ